MPPVINSVISPPPRFDVRKIIVCDRSTRRLSPSVSVALSRIPSSNCHSASDAFSISSNSRKLSFIFSVWYLRKLFLRDQRMRLAVPQVSRRRADQLGDFVRVLELRAVHLDHRARVAEQDLRRGFHDARFARAGGSEEQQVPHRTSRRAHSGAEDLIQVHQRADALFLADDLVAQRGLEFLRLHAAQRGIEMLTLLAGWCAWPSLLPEIPTSVKTPRCGARSNWSSLTPTVECSRRNCVTNSCPASGACETSSSGGNRSAKSRLRVRRVGHAALDIWRTSGRTVPHGC